MANEVIAHDPIFSNVVCCYMRPNVYSGWIGLHTVLRLLVNPFPHTTRLQNTTVNASRKNMQISKNESIEMS